MKVSYLDYSETKSFTEAIYRYLKNDPELRPFQSHFPDIEGFRSLITRKKNIADRTVLTQVLNEQYSRLSASVPSPVIQNIALLAEKNTYTVTTGHQLNIFTGPLYFIFKIVTSINLAKELKSNFPDQNFVPVYWMATEDHDFEEISYTYIAGKKVAWEKETQGATGRIDTAGIEKVIKEYAAALGLSENADMLHKLINQAYTGSSNLADATREMVNSLFGEYGLVILDADDARLKKKFAPLMINDITEQNSYRCISATNKQLNDIGVAPQVNPREINFFYLTDDLRERIVYENNSYSVLNTEIRFSEEELKQEINAHPERFSPNVVMRPLYQECILPNLAYIGGGAEVVYWMQLKQTFDFYGVHFPVLLLRNSALIASHNLESKLNRLNLSFKDLFTPVGDLEKGWVLKHSDHTLDLHNEWQEISSIFERIKLRTYKIDPTLGPSTEAVRARLSRAFKRLETKIMKAEKRNFAEALEQIGSVKSKLFPGGNLQERSENFGLLYVRHGRGFIQTLIDNFRPLDLKFTIIED